MTLRLALLVDTLELYAWEAVMLERIRDSGAAQIVLVVLCEPAKPRVLADLDPRPRHTGPLGALAGELLLKAYRALESIIPCEPDAFASSDAAILRTIHRISMPAAAASNQTRVAEALDEMRRFDLDVIVQLGAAELGAVACVAAKHGVWSLRHARCANGDAAAVGFWPVYQRWPVIESRIEAVTSGAKPAVLARCFTGIMASSVKLSRNALFWKTLSLMPRKLLELLQQGAAPQPVAARSDVNPPDPADYELGAPTIAQLGLYIASHVRRRGTNWALRKFTREQWTLLFHLGEDLCTSMREFKALRPPRDRFWADPCVVRKNDAYYVFFEEYPFATGKGYISVLAINENGTHTEPVKVLEHDHHLSYPQVFEEGDEIFMIPESFDNRTIDLYRCVDFPLKWEFVKTLLDDIAAVDTTVLKHRGKWWMFTNVVENTGASSCEELFLFHSDSLIDGTWTPHAHNPVVSDVRKSRPAGPIFRYRNELYRPAQDCSARYGYAIVLNRITELSEARYAEVEVESIRPTWDPGVVATHSLSYVPDITVTDALWRRLGP